MAQGMQETLRVHGTAARYQHGKTGYILLWLIGVPIPFLLLVYLLRGCT